VALGRVSRPQTGHVRKGRGRPETWKEGTAAEAGFRWYTGKYTCFYLRIGSQGEHVEHVIAGPHNAWQSKRSIRRRSQCILNCKCASSGCKRSDLPLAHWRRAKLLGWNPLLSTTPARSSLPYEGVFHLSLGPDAVNSRRRHLKYWAGRPACPR
jgi:hypothetical protein